MVFLKVAPMSSFKPSAKSSTWMPGCALIPTMRSRLRPLPWPSSGTVPNAPQVHTAAGGKSFSHAFSRSSTSLHIPKRQPSQTRSIVYGSGINGPAHRHAGFDSCSNGARMRRYAGYVQHSALFRSSRIDCDCAVDHLKQRLDKSSNPTRCDDTIEFFCSTG